MINATFRTDVQARPVSPLTNDRALFPRALHSLKGEGLVAWTDRPPGPREILHMSTLRTKVRRWSPITMNGVAPVL